MISARSVFDCRVFSDALFQQSKITNSEHEILMSLNNNINCGNHNHTFIYLKTPPKVAFRRIQGRHQRADEYLTETYLEKLSECYERFYTELNPYQKICLETEDSEISELVANITQFINQLFVPYYPYTYTCKTPFF
jgi:thymidylate kinase